MTYVKEAEDLDLRPVFTAASALVTSAMLHAPHQPSNITSIKLFVVSVRWSEPKAGKPMENWSVSAKLPFVFLLLVQSWRLEAGRTAPSLDLRQVGPGKQL